MYDLHAFNYETQWRALYVRYFQFSCTCVSVRMNKRTSEWYFNGNDKLAKLMLSMCFAATYMCIVAYISSHIRCMCAYHRVEEHYVNVKHVVHMWRMSHKLHAVLINLALLILIEFKELTALLSIPPIAPIVRNTYGPDFKWCLACHLIIFLWHKFYNL